MDRLTKIVVLAWICAAIAFQVWVQTPGWPNLPLVTALVAATSLAAGFLEPRLIAAVLAISYFFPVIIRTLHGGTAYAPNEIVWITALAGVLLPGAARTPWNIPARWRASLVAAALVVVVTSPMICLREIDLNPGLLRDLRGWSFGGGTWPSLIVTWSLYSSLTLVVGLVWFDWLFSARDLNFERYVVMPLALSASVLLAVLIYQLFVDVGFLNDTIYGVIGRAGGTMYDANLSGTVAALWVGGLVALAWRSARYRTALATIGGLAAWLGVWASGSRTAFGAAALITFAIVIAAAAEKGFSRVKRLYIPAAVIVGVVGVFIVLIAAASPRIVGPATRVWATLPSPSVASIRGFAAEMWNRNRYGLAATAIIKDHPLFGIGVGTYQTIAFDYVSDGPLQPDNAQNWLRHEIVEFGLIGSLGWIIWFVSFALFVLRFNRHDDAGAWITRGMLVAFGAISMLGMPGQAVVVAVTFWTIAFWYASFNRNLRRDATVPRWTWIAVVLVAAIAGAGTAWDAATTLRVPERARASTWPYSYGFAAPRADGDGYRQARSHALAVLDVPSRWLSVSVRPDTTAAGRQPVDVRVWADGATVLKAQLQNSGPLTAIVQLPSGSKRVLLEAAGRRIDSSRPFFVRDAEALYFLKWEFLERPPADFNGAGYHRPITS